MGSDSPGKQELDPEVLSRADVVAVDWPDNAAAHGELQHLPQGSVSVVSLGAIAAGAAEGRTSEDQITIADLVGLGVPDAAVTEALLAAMSDAAEVG